MPIRRFPHFGSEPRYAMVHNWPTEGEHRWGVVWDDPTEQNQIRFFESGKTFNDIVSVPVEQVNLLHPDA